MLKEFAPLIGLQAAALLDHISSSLEDESSVFKNERLWHRQTTAQTLYATGLTHEEFRHARQLLLDERLIDNRRAAAGIMWWSLPDKFYRFREFAALLRFALRPDKKTISVWREWALKNSKIIEEFRHLWPRVDSFLPEKKLAFKVKQTLGSKIPVDSCPSENRWVEFWNSLPHVPKCKPGSKAYNKAKAFFAAHHRYEAGQCRGFMLTKDVRKKLRLDKINKHPEDVTHRPDAEMYAHIEQAALAYYPTYAPVEKKWLGGLDNFLYINGEWSKMGTRSYFLERVAFAPQLIEDNSYQKMIDKADDWELDIVEAIKHVYFVACRRDKAEQLSLSEFKSALIIARKIAEKYIEIPTDKVSILAHHFSDYSAFVTWWKNYCEEHVWDGMPLTALDPTKDMWRRFIDYVSDDIGFNILTGERR